MHGDGVELEIENQKEYIFPEKNEIIATRSTNPRDSANTYPWKHQKGYKSDLKFEYLHDSHAKRNWKHDFLLIFR